MANESDGETDGGVDTTGTTRDAGRAIVAVAAVLGLVTAASLVPALAVPLPAPAPEDPDRPEGPDVADRPTELNALAPGDRVTVGGPGTRVASFGGAPNRTHFYVHADRPAYWRTGAYGQYTGEGWARFGDVGRLAPTRSSGEKLHQRVTLKRPATALPGAWRPTRVDVEGDTVEDDSVEGVYGTERGALSAPGGVPAGTTYEVTSSRPAADEWALRTAGTDYPDGVRRYARRPGTTDRVRRLADRVTAGADSPYEAAVAVERYLETEKRYSLSAGVRGDRVADRFLFETEAGYCEQFATAMAVMLRSQGIPARYVVGYAPGTQVDRDTYRVRSVDAHAWVEVYFPGTGWVRFDPTPAGPRVAAERAALADHGVGSDRRPGVEGSPAVDGGTAGPGTRVAPSVGDRPGSLSVSLASDPVPGREVTVTVSEGGLPVAGAVVAFDGERVGVTGRNGKLSARVPYDGDLTVRAERPGGESLADDPDLAWPVQSLDATPEAGYAATGVGPAPGPWTGAWSAGEAGRATDDPAVGSEREGSAGDADAGAGADGGESATRRYDLSTDATVSVVDGVVAPGRSATLRVSVGDTPVPGVAVSLGDDVVGWTDREGTVEFRVPEDVAGTVRLSADRGAVGATERVRVKRPTVTVDPHTVLALPGASATARVTVGDEPVSGAPVYVDGEYAGTTDEDGEVAVALPVERSATVRVETDHATARTAVTGLFVRPALLFGGVLGLLLVGAVGVVGRRRDVDVDARMPGWVPDAAAAGLAAAVELAGIGVGAVEAVGAWVRRRLVGVWTLSVRAGVLVARAGVSTAVVVREALVGLARLPLAPGVALDRASDRLSALSAAATTAVIAVVTDGPRGLARLFGGLSAGLLALGVALVPFTDARLGDVLPDEEPTPPATDPRRGGAGTADAAGEDTDPGPLSVRAAWRALVAAVGLGGRRTMTPGEIARAAVDRGLPAGPVRTVLSAFRDVEYGNREADEDLRTAVTDAVDRLRGGASDDRDRPARDSGGDGPDAGDGPGAGDDSGAGPGDDGSGTPPGGEAS